MCLLRTTAMLRAVHLEPRPIWATIFPYVSRTFVLIEFYAFTAANRKKRRRYACYMRCVSKATMNDHHMRIDAKSNEYVGPPVMFRDVLVHWLTKFGIAQRHADCILKSDFFQTVAKVFKNSHHFILIISQLIILFKYNWAIIAEFPSSKPPFPETFIASNKFPIFYMRCIDAMSNISACIGILHGFYQFQNVLCSRSKSGDKMTYTIWAVAEARFRGSVIITAPSHHLFVYILERCACFSFDVCACIISNRTAVLWPLYMCWQKRLQCVLRSKDQTIRCCFCCCCCSLWKQPRRSREPCCGRSMHAECGVWCVGVFMMNLTFVPACKCKLLRRKRKRFSFARVLFGNNTQLRDIVELLVV